MHIVAPGPKLPQMESLSLTYGSKPPSVFSLPWPCPEEAERPREIVEHNSHACGLGRHFYSCVQPDRCVLPFKAPCTACEDKVQASYRAGRFAVAR